MKKYLLFIILIILGFSSCRTSKSIITEYKVEYKYDTIVEYLPSEVQIKVDSASTKVLGDSIQVLSDSILEILSQKGIKFVPNINSDTMYAEVPLAYAKAGISNSKPYLELYQKDTVLTQIKDSLQTKITILTEKLETYKSQEIKVKTKNSSFANFTIFFFITSIVGVALFLIKKLKLQ